MPKHEDIAFLVRAYFGDPKISFIYFYSRLHYHKVKSQVEKSSHFAKNRPLNSVSQCNLDVLRASKVKQLKISMSYPRVNLLKSLVSFVSFVH